MDQTQEDWLMPLIHHKKVHPLCKPLNQIRVVYIELNEEAGRPTMGRSQTVCNSPPLATVFAILTYRVSYGWL
jgi:hypothetical protein